MIDSIARRTYTVLEAGHGAQRPDAYAVTVDADGIAYLHVMSRRRAHTLAQSIRDASGHAALVVRAEGHAQRFAGIEHHTANGPRRIRRYPPALYRSLETR